MAAPWQQRHSKVIWRKRQATQCSNLYLEPQTSQIIPAFTPFTVEWDPNCITESSTAVDIYLYDLTGQHGPIFKFQNVDANTGSFQTAFNPKWWNATQAGSQQLRLQFANQGEPNWASPYSIGPVFNVDFNGTYPSSTSDTSTTDPIQVINDPSREKAIEAGKLVAAILIPLLVAIIAIGGYVWWSRKRQAKQSKRWSQAVDRRMSQISQNWVASRPQSMAASQRSQAHARNGSNYSFSSPGASIGHGRQPSAISFAAQDSPSKTIRAGRPLSRPFSTASYPRLGSNGKDILTPLSPEQESPEMLKAPFQRSHGPSSSMTSSLRNEVSMFDEEQLAAAVSVINGDRQLKSSTDRPVSGLSYETAPGSQSDFAAHGHLKQPSLVSLTVPRLDRASTMSPDNALEAYARSKSSLKVTTHVASRSVPNNNPFTKSLSTKLPTSNSNPDLQVNFGEAQ